MNEGWLVNDCLTCIPGTKTFWHDLLECVPGLQDRTFDYTPFEHINAKLNKLYKTEQPKYIIRNGTFFDSLDISKDVRTISLIQDVYTNGKLRATQENVINTSYIVVFNSLFTFEQYKECAQKVNFRIIPLGVDFDFFRPLQDKNLLRKELHILPNSILYVGSECAYPKGFDILMEVVNRTTHNFCFVMKTNFHISHPRIVVFNKIDHNKLLKVYNACDMLICPSKIETLHLAGVEAAACGLPIIASNVGIYYNRQNGLWGQKAQEGFTNIDSILKNLNAFKPREYFLNEGLDTKTCNNRWKTLVEDLIKGI